MSEPNDILSHDHGNERTDKLREETLMLYLEGKLTPKQQHEVEQWLADEGMEADALEGLQTLNAGETRASINKLNQHLHKTLGKRKHKRRVLKTDHNTLIAIALVIALAIIAYIVIRKSI
jgi:ferric-dicitrate binding protein FerR (iron transport regulator)